MASPANPPTADTATRLEAVLNSLIEAHQRLLDITREHRDALSRADGDTVQRCTQETGTIAAAIAALEQERRQVVSLLGGNASPQPTVTALAQRLPEPARGRIVALAAALKDLLLRVQRETAVVRAATQSLVSHMDGLMQQVARTLSQARLYGRGGKIDPGGPVACGIDLTH